MQDSIQQEIVKWSSKRFFFQNENHRKTHNIDLEIIHVSEIEEHFITVQISNNIKY